ncbi:aprataxin and PNK-like factor [Stigmatopora argus]
MQQGSGAGIVCVWDVPMSGFELIPVQGGDAIHLPAGETVVGRGPFLHVSDKRVSRHHGLLDNQDGRLRLKPTHLNPCFKQSCLTDEPQALEKDVWCPLDHGDVISLLPGQLMFRVVAVGGRTVNGPFRQNVTRVNHSPPHSPKRSPPRFLGCHGSQIEASNQESPLMGKLSNKEAEASQHASASPSTRKKRLLPSWMTEAVKRSPSQTIGTTAIRQVAKKRQQTEHDNDQTTKVKRSKKEGRPAVEWTKIKSPLSHEPLAKLEANDHQSQEGVDSSGMETKDGHDLREIPADTSDVIAGTSNNGAGTSDVATGTSGRQSASVEGAKARVRGACPYGKDCYRKNPLHFQECSHPDDPDFVEEERPAEGERPECPYGSNCYRKNPLHRIEYNHTERAVSSRQAALRAKVAPGVASDRDSGDSFIDDESDDAEADSDYVPPADSD